MGTVQSLAYCKNLPSAFDSMSLMYKIRSEDSTPRRSVLVRTQRVVKIVLTCRVSFLFIRKDLTTLKTQKPMNHVRGVVIKSKLRFGTSKLCC